MELPIQYKAIASIYRRRPINNSLQCPARLDIDLVYKIANSWFHWTRISITVQFIIYVEWSKYSITTVMSFNRLQLHSYIHIYIYQFTICLQFNGYTYTCTALFIDYNVATCYSQPININICIHDIHATYSYTAYL